MPEPRGVGLVVGKFAPLHAGHQFLIETARAASGATVIAVYDSPGYGPTVRVRANWIRRLYPDTLVLELDDPVPQGDPEDVSRAYAEHLRSRYAGPPVTHVFSSEEYGARFARELRAEHVPVDPERRRLPVSATLVRSNPFAYRHYLDPCVYRSLVVKVCFVGAESTGKTTLAEAVAERHGTVWMPEYGRELFELERGALVFGDLLRIAREHLRREEKLLEHANRFLLCDTNAITTEFWSRFYFGTADPELEQLARSVERDYAYVLCANDIPWVQDGWRETGGGELWLEHQETIRADLEARGLDYIEASGTVPERVERVSRWLEERGSYSGPACPLSSPAR